MSKDPGNPRLAVTERSRSERPVVEANVVRGESQSAAVAIRGVCLAVGACLLIVGSYYAIEVFHQVGALIQDPSQRQAAVRSIGEMISADQLVFPTAREPVEAGGLISFFLLIVLYLLWLHVPAVLIRVGVRIMLDAMQWKPRPPQRKGN